MTERSRSCPDDHVLVELALGQLDGRERADALAHLVSCEACRTQVRELTEVVDQILLAAPAAEPPERFESTVLDQLHDRGASRRRTGRLFLTVAAAIVVVVAAVSVLVVADGSPSVVKARMVTPAGRDVGSAWRYADDPPWVFVSVPAWRRWEDTRSPPGNYVLRAGLEDGTTIELGQITFSEDAHGSWGITTPVDAERIRTLSIIDDTSRVWCMATF